MQRAPLKTRIANAIDVVLGRRSMDVAGGSGRWPANASLAAPAVQLHAARPIASMRAAYLSENSSYGSAYVESMTVNLVGDGPSLRSNHPDPAVRARLEASWSRFYSRCDAEGLGDLLMLLRRVARSLVISGEAFIIMSAGPAGGLELKLISPEQVQPGLSFSLPGGNQIVGGVEIDTFGRRVAFHISPGAPDGPFPVSMPVRVSVEDVLHIFEPRYPGQQRGISWMSAIASKLVEIDKLEDALSARYNTSALFGGFVTDPDGSSGFSDGATGTTAELSLEPGSVRVLPVGTTIQFPAVPDAGGAPEFLRHQIRSIAAGGQIPYELVSGDLSQVNFSSARLGLEQFKRRIKALQSSLLVAQLLEPIWSRFVVLEVLTGRIDAAAFDTDPEVAMGVSVMWPSWASLDPQAETIADVTAMQANLRSRFEIIAARGRDPQEVDQEIAADTLKPAVAPQVPNAA